MTPQIIPTILATSERQFKARAMIMEGTAEIVQIDIMDGTFVPGVTWYHPEIVAEWGLNIGFELHCMVNDPLPIIDRWRRVHGFKRAIIHAEIPEKLGSILSRIRQHKIETGLALSPGTPLSVVAAHVSQLDEVLVMGGKPGVVARPMNRKTILTARELRKLFPSLQIGFDIGVNRSTIPTLVRAGVTRLCAGHAIFRSPSPIKAYKELGEIARRAAERR
jgi:ribulose-phosphate 3-epimerase